MTPIICDFTGKVIEAQFDPKNGPTLNKDYFAVHNRILSLEGKEKLEEIVWETMKSRGFGNYNFAEYKRVYKAALEQYCNRAKNVYAKQFRAEAAADYGYNGKPHW